MQRSKVVKSLFWELRAAGIEASAKDTLRLAHFILQSHLGEVDRADDFGKVVDSRALPLLPVDVVLADGGWRVLDFENSRVSHLESEVAHDAARQSKLRKMLGSLWPR